MGEGSYSSVKHSRRAWRMRSYLGGLVLFSIAPHVALERWKLSMGRWVWELGKGFKHQTGLGVGIDGYCWSPSLITDTYWCQLRASSGSLLRAGKGHALQRSEVKASFNHHWERLSRMQDPALSSLMFGAELCSGVISLGWAARPGCTGLPSQEARQKQTIP